MPQKTKGATQALQHIYADIQEVREKNQAVYEESLDAVFVRARTHEIERLLLAIERQIHDGIEPLLERQAPQYEARLAKLEEQVKTLLEQPHIVARAERRKA